MPLRRVTAADTITELEAFSAVIDARSESEYAEDRLPGAQNWPTLNDAERATIGTAYKQDSPFEARKQGAVLAARNIAMHIEAHAAAMPRGWKPLVYCWRGGQRSGSLATVLATIGFDVAVLEGGYRAFRREVIAALETASDGLAFQVLCGPTGSGKSRLLAALAEAGAQVLDLEGLASHRGSVLGALPDAPQPSQKRFETLAWQALAGFDRSRPVYVESESRLVGRLRVPERLLEAMRAAPCFRVEMPISARVGLLIEDYAHFVHDAELLCSRLFALRQLRGAAVVERWQAMARKGEIAALVAELLTQHYDPIYQRSMGQNYRALAEATLLEISDGSPLALRAVVGAMGR
jgi:tRNA 2-selenouridine synthase